MGSSKNPHGSHLKKIRLPHKTVMPPCDLISVRDKSTIVSTCASLDSCIVCGHIVSIVCAHLF